MIRFFFGRPPSRYFFGLKFLVCGLNEPFGVLYLRKSHVTYWFSLRKNRHPCQVLRSTVTGWWGSPRLTSQILVTAPTTDFGLAPVTERAPHLYMKTDKAIFSMNGASSFPLHLLLEEVGFLGICVLSAQKVKPVE